MKPSSLGADVRLPARNSRRISTPLAAARTGTSAQQPDAAAGHLRAAWPPVQRANDADTLERVKYTLIDGPPGHRVTQAWLDALARSDADSGTP